MRCCFVHVDYRRQHIFIAVLIHKEAGAIFKESVLFPSSHTLEKLSVRSDNKRVHKNSIRAYLAFECESGKPLVYHLYVFALWVNNVIVAACSLAVYLRISALIVLISFVLFFNGRNVLPFIFFHMAY